MIGAQPQRQGEQSGDVQPPLLLTFAPSPPFMRLRLHVRGHRGGGCGGKEGRRDSEGKSLGGVLGKAFLKRRLHKVKSHKRPRGWMASLDSVMRWEGGKGQIMWAWETTEKTLDCIITPIGWMHWRVLRGEMACSSSCA